MKSSYIVKLDVQLVFEMPDAISADDALEKAKQFQQTISSQWNQYSNAVWTDQYIVKETVERQLR
jgi:hypothetical protein